MIYPMFCMIVLTFIVGVTAFFTRVNSVKSGSVNPRAYKLMNAEAYPDSVVKTTRCFNNQFELPVLFYVGCLAVITMGETSLSTLLLAWSFVALRFVHAYIHITYNHLLHRVIVFWLGAFVVLALWINLTIQVAFLN